MPERIKITIRASGAHPDVLTVEDAMRQVLDIFELLQSAPGVEWKLTKATTNSPFCMEGEAVSFEPSVDVSVVARAEKVALARNLRDLISGAPPADPDFQIKTARQMLARNLNGVGATEIDFEQGEPVLITPRIADEAIRVLDHPRAVGSLYDFATPRDEVGSVEGTLQSVGAHWNHAAIRIVETRTGRAIPCRLSAELTKQFADKATFADVWQHRRVIVRGRIKRDTDGHIEYVLANDLRRIETTEISLEQLADRNFTGGLSIVEYLNRFRDGTLG